MVGTIASFHDTVAVIITMGATLAITVAIIAFSAQVRQARAAAFPFYTVYTQRSVSEKAPHYTVYLN